MMIKLTDYRIIELRYPYGIYKFGHPVKIMDEGSFYRIDNTHIFDKFKIKSIKLDGNRLTIHMKDMDAILTIEK